MANDRIFLRCPICKKSRLLYKYYPAGGYTWDPNAPDVLKKEGEPDDFMDWHLHECGNRFDGDLNGDPFFELITESRRTERNIA